MKAAVVRSLSWGGVRGSAGVTPMRKKVMFTIINRLTVRTEQKKRGVIINDALRSFTLEGLFQLHGTCARASLLPSCPGLAQEAQKALSKWLSGYRDSHVCEPRKLGQLGLVFSRM